MNQCPEPYPGLDVALVLSDGVYKHPGAGGNKLLLLSFFAGDLINVRISDPSPLSQNLIFGKLRVLFLLIKFL